MKPETILSSTTTAIDPATVQAYRETEYRVRCDPPLILHVGQASDALLSLFTSHGVDSAAFITACNPYSQIIDAAANLDRQNKLAAELSRRGLHFFPGVGQHPSNSWPGEAGFLTLGLYRQAAIRLGKDFEQNAIIYCGAEAIPELILLR